MESILEKGRKQGKPKGSPKSGGRKIGTPNKVTVLATTKFHKACAENNFDFGKELITSLISRDLDYAKVLISIMDYYFGKISPEKTDQDGSDDAFGEIKLKEVFK